MDPPAHRTSNLKSTTVLKAMHNAPAKKPTYLTQQLPLQGNPAQGGIIECLAFVELSGLEIFVVCISFFKTVVVLILAESTPFYIGKIY